MSVVPARSSPPRRRRALAVAGAACLSFGAAAVAGNRLGPSAAAPAAPPAAAAVSAASSIASPAAPAGAHDCAGAAEDLVTVELVPEAISSARGGGERMGVGIDVHHHFGSTAALAGAVEVIDDRGRRIGPASDLAVRSVAARAKTAYRFETPDRLADGYYRLQATVLARGAAGAAGAAGEDFSTHQLYFHVAGGELTPITSHEWLTRSQSGLAFRSPTPPAATPTLTPTR